MYSRNVESYMGKAQRVWLVADAYFLVLALLSTASIFAHSKF